MWNYMCIRWLINWSDSTKMHGAKIRFIVLFGDPGRTAQWTISISVRKTNQPILSRAKIVACFKFHVQHRYMVCGNGWMLNLTGFSIIAWNILYKTRGCKFYTHTHTHTHTHTYIHTYIHTYTHTHIYTHTQTNTEHLHANANANKTFSRGTVGPSFTRHSRSTHWQKIYN